VAKRDTLVTVTEHYEYPKKPAAATGSCKVKNCFSLDSNDTVYIKFKNIPRKLKTVDPIFDLYSYDYNGNLGKSTTPSPGGFISNNCAISSSVYCIFIKLGAFTMASCENLNCLET
ncbi:MAG: hypothetical protein WCK35_18975, partial [Chloroflexota bacterium]